MYKYDNTRIIKNLKTREEFVDFVSKNDYVIVKCGAKWCGPCQRIKSTAYSLFEKMDIKCLMVDIDVDESPEIASALRVKVLPTFINFIKGEQQDIYPTADPVKVKEFFNKTYMRLDD
tara:strand:- start:34 stop:387 length:354 start_codon:yes stop_codon:yes gene_type:complete